MVDYSSYSDSKMQARIIDAVTDIRGKSQTYNKLPPYVRDRADAGYTLGGIAEAADNEYEKAKQSIKGMASFNDPRGINGDFAVSFQSVVTDTSRIQLVTFIDANTVRLPEEFSGGAYNGYLVGFGLQFRNLIGISPISDRAYRRVITFEGGVATLEAAVVGAENELTYAILCWPDRVDIPGPVIADPRTVNGVMGGTVLPPQNPSTILTIVGNEVPHIDPDRIVKLPGHLYISGVPVGAWDGWSLRFLDGVNEGQDFPITSHLKSPPGWSAFTYLSLQSAIPGGAVEGDWFTLIPTASDFFSSAQNAFRGMFIQASAVSASSSGYLGQGLPKQTREIISSEFSALSIPAKTTAFIFNPSDNSGTEFEYPIIPDSFVGISNNYIELAQLADYLGIYLDDLDPDLLQREQIASAYDFHRVRGTKAGIELLCRLRGFEASIEELSSTFTPGAESFPTRTPGSLNTSVTSTGGGFIHTNIIGATVTVAHKQLPNEELSPDLVVPQNGQGVPRAYVATAAGRNDARIPDSDVNIYVERVNPLAQVSVSLFQRLARQLTDQGLPAHVSINILGILQRFNNNVWVADPLRYRVGNDTDLIVEVTGDLLVVSIGDGSSFIDEPASVSSSLLLTMPARYGNTRSANTFAGASEGVPRWTIGTTRLA
jgi:hypothetical protein